MAKLRSRRVAERVGVFFMLLLCWGVFWVGVYLTIYQPQYEGFRIIAMMFGGFFGTAFTGAALNAVGVYTENYTGYGFPGTPLHQAEYNARVSDMQIRHNWNEAHPMENYEDR
jgi:hypothetical protein